MTDHKLILNMMFLFLVSFLLGGCTKSDNFIQPAIEGSWTVISFDDNVSMTKIIKTEANTWSQYNNGDNSVSFTPTSTSAGIISGINVTNSFSGSFEIYSDTITVANPLVWTQEAEPLWGRLFHSIEAVETYELKGDTLIIFLNQKNNSITLKKN
jgi:hypothetical protein